MKKLLPIGLLALSVALAAEERASAWINSRFGIGANWGWQSGGNNLLWGLLRDGQPCGPDLYHVEVPVYPRPACPGAYAPVHPGGFGGMHGGHAPAPAHMPPPAAPGMASPGFGGPAFGGPAGPGFGGPGFGGPPPAPGFGGPVGPGFGPPPAPGFPPVAPVSNHGMFNATENAIQAPTPPGTEPVSFYRQANYGHGYYHPAYRNYR